MSQAATLHRQRLGRNPKEPPERFTDKIYWSKHNDRRPILTQLTDKSVKGKYAIPTLHVGPDYIPSSYPFIAKPNHWSGYVRVIKNRDEWIEYKKLWERLRAKTYGQDKGEWAYKNITPKLIIEPVIEDFWDMKCYVFAGKVEAFYVCGRGEGRPEKNGVSYFWPDGNFIDVTHNGHSQPFKEVPFDFKKAVKVAEEITPDIDFVRTDLMVADKIYVSEFTLYPGSGCIRFDPDSFDEDLGKKWNIETVTAYGQT